MKITVLLTIILIPIISAARGHDQGSGTQYAWESSYKEYDTDLSVESLERCADIETVENKKNILELKEKNIRKCKNNSMVSTGILLSRSVGRIIETTRTSYRFASDIENPADTSTHVVCRLSVTSACNNGE